MKLLAAVITYYPDISDATQNIARYIGFTDQLIIWENTPEADRSDYALSLPGYEDKVLRMGTGRNEGIGFALNRVVEYGLANGYTHLLTMDQDSLFVDFGTYLATVARHDAKPHIGLFSPNVNGKLETDAEIISIPEAITSGTIYKMEVFARGLRFREDYFIDMVDNEFCYKAHRHGFETACLPQCILHQHFGDTTHYRVGITSLNYSAFRIYHLIRNYLITWKEYPDLIQGKNGFITKMLFNRALKIIFLEKGKCSKFRALWWGLYDGLRGRTTERNFKHKES